MTVLAQLLSVIKEDALLNTLSLYPNESDSIEECIIYTFNNLQNDGIKRQDSFKLRVKAFSYLRAIEVAELLKKAFITRSDRSLTQDIIECRQNGGGEMYNDETKLHTITIILNLKSKVR